jgi:hypothetical protein
MRRHPGYISRYPNTFYSLKVHNQHCRNPKCTDNACVDSIWDDLSHNDHLHIPNIHKPNICYNIDETRYLCCRCAYDPHVYLSHIDGEVTCLPCYIILLKALKEQFPNEHNSKTYNFLHRFYSRYMSQKRSERLPSIHSR